jgi:hypothetical protein
LLGLGLFPTPAGADGDPASDVLATQSLFLPQDAGIPVAQQGQLSGLLTETARAGYPIRVAVIASSADLGSVTELWRQPQAYAQFLAQELGLVYRGPLLVVMPEGFGFHSAGGAAGSSGSVASSGSAASSGRSVLAGVRITASRTGLGTATLTAVQRLATASGHPVPIPAATASGSGSGSSDPVAVIVFVAGAGLIVVSWAVSLRARPPRLHRRPLRRI